MIDAAYRGEHLELEILSLPAGTSRQVAPAAGEEAAVVLLEGLVELDGEVASRTSVFDERASAAYVPPGGAITIDATRHAELALVTTIGYSSAPADAREGIALVRPADVTVQTRGAPGWQRDVHDVIAGTVPARHLLVGETFNEPGQWSSFPPHKHDGRDGEPVLEEIYYYRFDRPDGFGFQGLYDDRGAERAVFLRHGSIVGIPHGYHPVCAAPGYRLYYLWALCGEHRGLAMYEDPAHRWLAERTE